MENRAIEPDSASSHTFAILSQAIEEFRGMLRNLFLIVPFLLLVHVTSAVALPECPGSYDNTTWTNCEGAYVWPDGRKYEGEFESGKFH